MPVKVSSGLLPYRVINGALEVLLAHYGGPLWAKKDLGSWTVVKGEPRQTDVFDRQSASLAGRSPAPKPDSDAIRNENMFDRVSGAGSVVEEGEELLQSAKREFVEETGVEISSVTNFIPLGNITQKGGKTVHAWAFDGQNITFACIGDNLRVISVNLRNVFEMEWPPRSGNIQQFPEIDRAEWFSLDEARQKINPAQIPFLDRLRELLG